MFFVPNRKPDIKAIFGCGNHRSLRKAFNQDSMSKSFAEYFNLVSIPFYIVNYPTEIERHTRKRRRKKKIKAELKTARAALVDESTPTFKNNIRSLLTSGEICPFLHKTAVSI